MHGPITEAEGARLGVQRTLDEARTAVERNRLGQFATPTALARALLRLGLGALPPDESVRFLDPALGTGAFFSALLEERGARAVERALGVEVDPRMVEAARSLWASHGLEVLAGDFTELTPPAGEQANLLIANPPYVRHHHLTPEAKARLRRLTRQAGYPLSGLAGLYCSFLLLSRAWMAPDGVAVWLVPSEFMDVNYGGQVKRFLLEQVTLLRVHRADPADVLFVDALVSSAVLVLQNRPPAPGHTVRFTQGGSLEAPRIERGVEVHALASMPKWTQGTAEPEATDPTDGVPLGELFSVKRGVATGGNAFFVLDEARVSALGLPREQLTPVLPPPRRLGVDRVEARPDGSPDLPDQRWLITCALPEEELRARAPALERYLRTGVPEVSSGYLCRRRSPWYKQEWRAPAPLLCTYMGRGVGGRPFRFILNRSVAIAGNVYLMLYPRPALAAAMEADSALIERLWSALNGLDPRALLREGRVYGGGLHKLEPAELAAVRLPRALFAAEPPEPPPPR